MTQDELNTELDYALEEAVFNDDITLESNVADMKAALLARVYFTEEQWLLWARHCLQVCIEKAMRHAHAERVQ